MSLITLKPTVTQRVPRGAKTDVKVYFTFNRAGSGVVPADRKVLLAVYDLDQYFQAQSAILSGFKEIDDAHFTGKETSFAGALQLHDVGPLTGVLFTAELELEQRPKPFNNLHWFVKSVSQRREQRDPAYTMSLLTDTRVDESGKDQPAAPIQLGSLGNIAVGGDEFDQFIDEERPRRRLAFRLLSLDLKTVLLSSLNPKHSSAGIPKTVFYTAAEQLAVLVKPSLALKIPPAPKPRIQDPDKTGWYLERLPGTPVETETIDLLSPSGLWIHQVGRALCGWYYPVRSRILTGTRPISKTRIFPNDVEEQMLSKERFVFVVSKFNGRGTPPAGPLPDGALDVLFLRAKPGALDDPDDILREDLVSFDRLAWGYIRFDVTTFLGTTFVSPVLSLDRKKEVRFNRLGQESRLSWRAFSFLEQSPNDVPRDRQAEFFSSIREDLVEPLPPAVLAALTAEVGSVAMLTNVVQYMTAKTAGQVSLQLGPESLINSGLEALANDLRLTSRDGSLPPALLLQVRSVARHHFIGTGAQRRSLLQVLEEISGDMLERFVRVKLSLPTPNPLPPGRPNDDDFAELAKGASYRGFAAFNIRPSSKFLYKFSFSKVTEAKGAGVILKGSIGGFRMTVEKLDPVTKKPVDPAFTKSTFTGVLVGGAIGVSVSLGVAGAKADGASPGGPVDCEVVSSVSLIPDDFQGARFVFFGQTKPSASVTAGPGIGVGNSFSDTVFSITLANRKPPVTLETVIEKPFLSFKEKMPDIDSAKSAAKGWVEAIKKGEPTKVPAAKASATLYALTLCCGYVVFTPSDPLKRPSENNTRVGELVETRREALVQGKRVAFPLRSAVMIEQAHLTLDVQLSVNRKLLEYPGWIDIEGLASPEWSQATRETAREQNLKLSLARAQAIEAAIFASAGPVGGPIIDAAKEILPMGLGFDPFEPFVQSVAESTDTNLLDPFTRPADAAQKAQYEAKLKEELGTKYPSLRRVDLAINGVFTVRLLGQ